MLNRNCHWVVGFEPGSSGSEASAPPPVLQRLSFVTLHQRFKLHIRHPVQCLIYYRVNRSSCLKEKQQSLLTTATTTSTTATTSTPSSSTSRSTNVKYFFSDLWMILSIASKVFFEAGNKFKCYRFDVSHHGCLVLVSLLHSIRS